MKIDSGKVVTIEYTLKNNSGELLDSSEGDEGFAYLHGANNIIPGLERALVGRSSGDEVNVSVEPDDAYGDRDESLVVGIPRDRFEAGTEIKEGMQFHAQTPQGGMVTVRVVGIEGDTVTIDGNHPLAGETLTFDVKVREVRDATDEERSHGHVHGAGDHHHDHD
jgi:FKBP-type peptidyl-prolyl cis-trans isomerase SlyD